MKTEAPDWAGQARLILFHKQHTSARTLFLRHANGSVVTPLPLPPLSMLLDEDEASLPQEVYVHPAMLARDYCLGLGQEPSLLQIEAEFHQRVETAQTVLDIYLARFTCIDPPRALFADSGKFCAITELRGGHPAEMGLLQKAYEAILG